jgi:DNA damage-binding protein 1
MDEFRLHDIAFLHGCLHPTIILIHQDKNGKHIKTYEISLRDKDIESVKNIYSTFAI